MSSRKRSRPVPEENRAECPFKVVVSTPGAAEEDTSTPKKRKREGSEDDRKTLPQLSPFSPTGKFKTFDTMDLHYSVEPRKRWMDMTRYNSFVLNGTKYFSEGFVFVANETTIERQKSVVNPDGTRLVRKLTDDWVARILEIRAADEHHVYARVYWMYWPDELPPNTLDGKKMVEGRQPYHGQNELIASNHMDIINVVSVTTPAIVNQWIESDDEEIQDALYWRQAFDVRTSQLSSVELICKCQTPANPDKTLIGCTNSKQCGKWLHYDCLLHNVLMKVYERLGTDKPHKTVAPAVKIEKEDDRAARPLSPTETKGEQTQPTIDVKPDETDQVMVKQNNSATPRPAETPRETPKASPAAAPSDSPLKLSKRGRKKAEGKPYLGLFEATLKMNEGPTVWEIKDLREDVWGGDSTWTEQANCLLCDHAID